MKNISVIIMAIVIATAFIKGTQASTIDSAIKTLDSSLTQLVTAKDETTANQLSLEEDLAFRKKVVNDALDLSLKEIKEIKEKLNVLKFDRVSDENSVKTQLISSLGESESRYRDLQGKLDREEDVEKIKDMARKAKAYREETYEPLVAKAINFTLSFQTDKLVVNADTRYKKIESDLKKLEKANLIESGQFNGQMNKAKELISDARALTNKAKSSIMDPQDENKPEEEALVLGEEKEPEPSARELAESALAKLKSAYGVFVNISGEVKKILKL